TRLVVFPRGRTYSAPSDKLGSAVVELLMRSTETRDRLTNGVYRTVEPHNALGLLHEVMTLADTAEPLEKRLRGEGVKTGRVSASDLPTQVQQALDAGILTAAEAAFLRDYDRKVMEIVNVDDFDTHELAAGVAEEAPRASARFGTA